MKNFRTILFIVSLLLAALACNLGDGAAPGTQPETNAADEPIADTAQTEAPDEPAANVHKITPGEFPEEPSGVVGDQDSSVTAEDRRAPGGDRFTFTRFERPFNSEAMDEYYPFIDIQEGLLHLDDTWIYVSITMKSSEASTELKGRYAVEIDLDIDGGGDWLILVSNPVSNEWSTDGVEAWFDTNDDVGGEIPSITDEKTIQDDGFETLVFGADTGDDPDLAWARVSAGDPNTVQLAVKKDILQGSKRFLAGLWAGNEDLDPALFDLSDHFTHEQAGAALIELNIFYPVKEVSAVDNTCRMAVGFQPTGKEPGLCPLPLAPGQETPLDPACRPENIVCTQTLTAAYVPPICICR